MAPSAGTVELTHLRLGPDSGEERAAAVVVEEPLEIRLGERPIAVTMRTPGHDVELALGFLVTEGILEDPGAVATAAHCDESRNVVEVRVEPGATGVHEPEERHFFATSSCGICGKASLDAVRVRTPRLEGDATTVGRDVLASLPARLREAQPLFDATGALHGAGLFTPSGSLLCAREDVGRHNAVDKVIGWAAARERLPLQGHVLLVTGRAGFEIVQKACVAGVPVLAAISGPSSLAVELARDRGMTLVAFLRGSELNVYSGARRVAP